MANYNRRRYKSNNNPRKQPEVAGDKTVLALPLEELNLNENTYNLLKSNNFNTVYDVACRTERDMYRVQTFNKKHLLHLKSKMTEKGVDFMPMVEHENVKKSKNEAEKCTENKNNEQINQDNGKVKQANNQQADTENKNERRNKRENSKFKKDKRTQQRTEPRQPRVELPVEEWRKVSKNGKWGFNNGLKNVIQPQFDEVFSFKEGLACVETDEKFGYINPEGEVVIPLTYECAMSFSEGLAVVFDNCKCGYINKDNEVVIGFKYDAATAFENGRAKVKSDGKWETISPDGSSLWSK